MATVTLTNLLDETIFLSDLYVPIDPGETIQAQRAYGEITAMVQTQALVAAGSLSMNVVYDPEETASGFGDLPPHASGHAATGGDPIEAASLSSGATTGGLVLETDGLGGFNFVSPLALGTPPDLFACPTTVVLGDVVYITSAGDTVDKASAEAGAGQTGDAIGVVVDKPSPTTCRVQSKNLSPVLFSGLVPGSTYFVSDTTPGGLTTNPPAASGTKRQEVGIAASSTKLFIDIDTVPILNP